MDKILLFTDGSVNTRTKVGYGAYLVVEDQNTEVNNLSIKLKRFEQTSSTKLELQIFLYALNNIKTRNRKIVAYTDSQNIISLPTRQEKLERNNYYSNNGKRLNNYQLYKTFYEKTASLNCKLVKLRGHSVSRHKEDIDRLFTLVDRASRKALRENE